MCLTSGSTEGRGLAVWRSGVSRLLRSSRQGFTLIELIVASSVSAMLLWATYVVFDSSNKVSNLYEAELELRQNARAVFARMELDLNSAFLDSTGRYFRGTGKSLKCVTAIPSDVSSITEVAYGRVYRSMATDGETTSEVSPSNTEDNVLIDGVLRKTKDGKTSSKEPFGLEYWDSAGEKWVSDAPAGQLPAAVKVMVWLTDSRGMIARPFFDIIPVGQGR
jgi:prepilin-type N-terminal cleavage/methylation domain-containing protein